MNIKDTEVKLDCFVSVVFVVKIIGDILKPNLQNLHEHLNQHFSDYEILLIDSYSENEADKSISHLLGLIPSIRHIVLSSSVSNEVALSVGLENAIGDYVILLSPDNDPVDCVYELVRKCQNGTNLVIGLANVPRTLMSHIAKPFLHLLIKKIGYNVPKNATELRCMSRKAVNAVTHSGQFHHQLFVRISKVINKYDTYFYKFDENKVKSQTLFHDLNIAVHLIIFNSTSPLRWMSGLGLLGSLLGFVFASYSILIRFFKNNVVEGWTTTILFSSILFMLLFLILAFFGEYLIRLLSDRNRLHPYSVLYEKHSTIMLNEKRCNVLRESLDHERDELFT